MNDSTPKSQRPTYVPAVGPKLNKLLTVVFGLFALLAVNAVYLIAIRAVGWWQGESYENLFYLYMFLAHLVLGALIVVPVIVFGFVHMGKARGRRNRRAVRVGYGLFAAALLLLVTGLVLTRIEGVIVVKDQTVRAISYWSHVLLPVVCAWLFVLHRLAGKRIKWNVGIRWTVIAGVFAGVMVVLQVQDPRKWNEIGNEAGVEYFFPSLARTVSGDFIPEHILQNDGYCRKCHSDVHDSWMASAHHLSSFNNEAYLAAVEGTRAFSMERDGNVNASRFCAGCHDIVPFFSGKFSDPDFDMRNDPTAVAGLTCTGCHAISAINSPRGNADYTIDTPIHYPFAFSSHPMLSWINEQLVKAKPDFHKKTFLKPIHKTTEFCGTCHKVHLPEELNGYKWLRGQNHQDTFLLSGVSGHGITSFYYPPKAEQNCNGCHMAPMESEDFSARVRDGSGQRKTLDHLFPSANTAVPVLAAEAGLITDEEAQAAVAAHVKFNEGVMRLDIFGIREDGAVAGALTAPLRPAVPVLEPGKTYLAEVVVRTVKMGHPFTQGTSDSNEVWMSATMRTDQAVLGRSGGMRGTDGTVDPYSHFINSFVLDRNGEQIAERNVEDTFTALYNHQIPPGAADVVHYRFTVPPDATGTFSLDVALRYRKFNTNYMQFVTKDTDYRNKLPILELAQDTVTFPLAPGAPAESAPAESASAESASAENAAVAIPTWQRWNDFGIGLLRKPGGRQLKQAEVAFGEVEALGRPDGPLNLARVYLAEGRIGKEAPDALRRARDFDPPANEWSVLWFTGRLNKQNGRLDEAIANYRQIVEGGFAQAAGRGFDFSKDWRVLVELGETIYQRARQERGESRAAGREAMLLEAASWLQKALVLDPEYAAAHYNLKLVYGELGEEALANEHAAAHAKYRVDDNAADVAIAEARRRYPAANLAAEAVVIYDLQREGAFELPDDAYIPDSDQ